MGSLPIKADGTFTVDDWPDHEAWEITKNTKRVKGKGTWELLPAEDEKQSDLGLAFDAGRGNE